MPLVRLKKSWHKVRISVGMKKDLQVWFNFLDSYNGVSVMLDHFWTSNEALEFFTRTVLAEHGPRRVSVFFFKANGPRVLCL
jgi:hypothetical protein